MNSKTIQFVSVFILAFLLGAVMIQVKQETVASAQDGTSLSGAVSPLLQYQGRLTDPDSGQPVADGSYTMTFRLYSTSSGGKALWTETKDVPVKGGLFSTLLGDVTPLAQNLFTGQALWLGIKVGADEEAKPRQQMVPVAYALSLAPGASIQANSKTAALNLSNAGRGNALTARGPVVVEGNLTVDGAINNPEIVTQYELEDHIYGGMHNGRAIAYGSINQHGDIYSASGNVSSKWNSQWECYEITIDGHIYDQRYYVTTVTSISGITSAWGLQGKLCVGIFDLELDAGDIKEKVLKQDFHFVTFKP